MTVVITPVQFEAFAAEGQARFKERLVAWLIRNHQRGGVPPANDDLCGRAAGEAIDLCRRHGVVSETDIAGISLRILRWGPKLQAPEAAHVLPILRDDSIPGDQKLSAIRLRDALREAGEAS